MTHLITKRDRYEIIRLLYVEHNIKIINANLRYKNSSFNVEGQLELLLKILTSNSKKRYFRIIMKQTIKDNKPIRVWKKAIEINELPLSFDKYLQIDKFGRR